MASFPCPGCGGELPEVLYRRMVTCSYCSKSYPNPQCLRVGDEVLVHGSFGLELVHVAKCEGPDAISLEQDAAPRRLEDVIPVVRATATLEARTGVYVRQDTGWIFTFTAQGARDGQLKVKNGDASFQDDLFDIATTLDDVRLDARPAELGGHSAHRTRLDTFLAGIRDAPFDSLVKYGIRAFFAIIFTIVAVTLVRGFFFNW